MDKWSEYLNESPLIERQFYGNPLLAWLVAAMAFVAALFFLRLGLGIVRRCAAALAERRNFYLTHAFLELSRSTKLWFLLIVSAYLGSLVLDLPHTATDWLVWLTVTALLVQLAFWADVLIALLLRRYVQRQLETDAASVTTMTAVGFFARLAAWTVTLLLVLRYAHIDVSTFLTGLGIGGVAVALAAQSVLVDLFASLSIVLDKPFILGDFIAVQDFLGSVEHIGLKTTRLRSLSGEQLVFSNSDLLGGRIRNYKRMTERRIEFTFGLRFTTPHDKLAAVPDMIRQAIAAQGRTRFDRAHLKSFGDSSFVFEVVYFVLSPDYNIYMDIQHAVNLALLRRFAESGIRLALPMQILRMHRAGNNSPHRRALSNPAATG